MNNTVARLGTGNSYRGVKQIIQFNWPWYAGAAFMLLGVAVAVPRLSLPWVLKLASELATVGVLFWFLSSLLVSYWVYDRSSVKGCAWLVHFSGLNPTNAANVHAGFDETTSHLQRLLPGTRFAVWDIFDASTMTERSILRARDLKSSPPGTVRVNGGHLPAADGSLDAVFAIFAAHEERSAIGREVLFGEFARVLRPGGSVFIVEHLRDWKNFLAYGPGFFHFFSARPPALLSCSFPRILESLRSCVCFT
jgi:SAM-dependent methyltransferase